MEFMDLFDTAIAMISRRDTSAALPGYLEVSDGAYGFSLHCDCDTNPARSRFGIARIFGGV